MKRLPALIKWTLVLGIFVLLLTILEFLALHDIKNEYVSAEILKHLQISLSNELPRWTSTTGEWRIVTISWLLRFIFLASTIVVLTLCCRQIKTKESLVKPQK